MKKLLYTVIAAMPFCGSSLLMTSCNDLFDTKSPSSMDDSNIFSIYDLAEGTIKNIYIYIMANRTIVLVICLGMVIILT